MKQEFKVLANCCSMLSFMNTNREPDPPFGKRVLHLENYNVY